VHQVADQLNLQTFVFFITFTMIIHSTYYITTPNLQKLSPVNDTYLKRDKKQVVFKVDSFITCEVVI